MVFTYAMIEEALRLSQGANEHQEATNHNTDLNEGLATISTMSQPTEGAVNAVLSTPELLSIILSQLETADLTRTLSVSKSWQQTILGAIELRRNLFLAPKETHEFLRWELGESEWEPRIEHDSISGGRPIVQVHPVLQPDLRARTCLYMRQHHDVLKTVSPSTFLTQPPVTEVLIDQKISNAHFERTLKLDLRCEVGVTFGDVIEELEVLHKRETSGGRTGRCGSSYTDPTFAPLRFVGIPGFHLTGTTPKSRLLE